MFVQKTVELLPRRFVRLPQELTYMEAFRSLPRRFSEVLDAP